MKAQHLILEHNEQQRDEGQDESATAELQHNEQQQRGEGQGESATSETATR